MIGWLVPALTLLTGPLTLLTGPFDPPPPELTLETGTHLFGAEAAADAARTTMVTGGGNPELRVWNLPAASPRRILRPPMGRGGQLFRIAISADGTVCAASVHKRPEGESDYCVYVYDLKSGRILRNLRGPHCATGLALSDDGSRLALGFASGLVALYDLRSQQPGLIGTSKLADSAVYGSHISAKGDIVFLHDAGHVAVFDRRMRRRAFSERDELKGARTARFSPDGRYLATSGGGNVTVFDAKTLSLVARLDTSHSGVGGFEIVSWSPNGKRLYAGMTAAEELEPGAPTDTGRRLLRCWQQGTWLSQDTYVGRKNIEYIVADNNGCYITYLDGSAAFVTATGRVRDLILSERLQFHQSYGRTGSSLVRANRDLTEVAVPIEQYGPKWLRVRLPKPRIALALESEVAHITPPAVTSGEFPFDPRTMTIAGKPMRTPGSRASAWAISPDHEFLYAGNIWSLFKFDRQGNLVRSWYSPKWTAQIHVSVDGETLLSSHFDGTLRWWSAQTGELLLSLFVHKPTLNWIAWTPAGAYDASLGGERFLQWMNVVAPTEDAELRPASHFRDRYFRPGEVRDALAKPPHSSIDSVFYFAQADLGALNALRSQEYFFEPTSVVPREDDYPPTVRVVRLENTIDRGKPALKYDIEYKSGPQLKAETLTLSADGRVVESLEAPSRATAWSRWAGTVSLVAPASEALVSVHSAGRAFPNNVHLANSRAGSTSGAGTVSANSPSRIFVISLGVNVVGTLPQLDYAEDDARKFIETMEQNKPQSVRSVVVYPIIGPSASKSAFETATQALMNLEPPPGPTDLAIVFVAGHGVIDKNLGYIIPLPGYNGDTAVTCSLRRGDIANLNDALQHCLRMFILDTCSAGAATEEWSALANLRDHGFMVWGACGRDYVARESVTVRHGYFTHALLQGLGGAIGETDRVTLRELEPFVDKVLESFGQAPECDRNQFPYRFVLTEPKRR